MADLNNDGIDDAQQGGGGITINSLGDIPKLIGSLFQYAFWAGLLAIGFSFIARTEWGQDLIRMLPKGWQLGLSQLLAKVGVDFTPEDMTVEETQKFLTGAGKLTPEQAEAIAPTQQAYDELTAIVEQETGKKDLQAGLKNPNVIFRILRDKPEQALAIAKAFKGAIDPKATAAAFKQFVADGRINELLAPGRMDNTLAILEASLPFSSSREALRQFIVNVGMEGGRLTPQFSTFLTRALEAASKDAASAPAALASAFSGLLADPSMQGRAADIAKFAASIYTEDPNLKPIFQLLSNEKAVTATMQLIQDIEAKEPGRSARFFKQLSEEMQNNNGTPSLSFLQGQLDIFTEIKTWAKSLSDANAVPTQWKSAVRAVAGLDEKVAEATRDLSPAAAKTAEDLFQPIAAEFKLLEPDPKPEKRVKLHELKEGEEPKPETLDRADRFFVMMMGGFEEKYPITFSEFVVGNIDRLGQAIPELTKLGGEKAEKYGKFLAQKNEGGEYVNLLAISTFLDAINKNPDNNTKARRDVTYAVYKLAMGDATVFAALPAKDIADYFADPTNRDAVGKFLTDIDPAALPEKERELVKFLSDNWYTQAKTENWYYYPANGLATLLSERGIVEGMQRTLGGKVEKGDLWLVDDWIVKGNKKNRDILETLKEFFSPENKESTNKSSGKEPAKLAMADVSPEEAADSNKPPPPVRPVSTESPAVPAIYA